MDRDRGAARMITPAIKIMRAKAFLRMAAVDFAEKARGRDWWADDREDMERLAEKLYSAAIELAAELTE